MIYQGLNCPAGRMLSRILSDSEGNLNAKNLSAEIADLLAERIIRGELSGGERILEAKVSKELGVAQSSLREALRILEQNGLVDINPRRGSYVRCITSADAEMIYDILDGLYQLIVRGALAKQNEEYEKMFLSLAGDFERHTAGMGFEDFFSLMFDLVLFGLQVIDSPVLTRSTLSLLPVKRRIEYMTLQARRDKIAPLAEQFLSLKELVLAADADGLCTTIHRFLQNEKRIALEVLAGGESGS